MCNSDVMYIEADIPLKDVMMRMNINNYIDTWKMVDENKYLDPKKTPLYKYYVQCLKCYKSKYDPLYRVAGKIELYLKIKEEGLDPTKQTRMTCTFDGKAFYIRNGHHRLSMCKHLSKPEILRILIWIPSKDKSSDVYV
jgi:hypothetical protein